MRFNSQKLILFSLLLFFVLGSSWLFSSSQKIIDPDQGKNWWVAFFKDHQGKALDFTLENHSRKKRFKYELFWKGEKIEEGEAEIEKGGKKLIPIAEEKIPAESGRASIKISAEEEIREIYKNL